jgi:hypothetical protein
VARHIAPLSVVLVRGDAASATIQIGRSGVRGTASVPRITKWPPTAGARSPGVGGGKKQQAQEQERPPGVNVRPRRRHHTFSALGPGPAHRALGGTICGGGERTLEREGFSCERKDGYIYMYDCSVFGSESFERSWSKAEVALRCVFHGLRWRPALALRLLRRQCGVRCVSRASMLVSFALSGTCDLGSANIQYIARYRVRATAEGLRTCDTLFARTTVDRWSPAARSVQLAWGTASEAARPLGSSSGQGHPESRGSQPHM